MYPNKCYTLTRSFEFFLLMVSCHLLIFLPLVFRLITLSFIPNFRITLFTPLPIYALSANKSSPLFCQFSSRVLCWRVASTKLPSIMVPSCKIRWFSSRLFVCWFGLIHCPF